MNAYLAAEHVAIRRANRSQEVLERFIERRKMRRKIAMYTSNVLSVPFIVMDTQLVATLPYAVVTRFASITSHLAASLPPFDITYDLKLHWHRRFDNEPRSIWLREQLATCGAPMQAHRERIDAEIRTVLDAEQRGKFETMRAEHRRRFLGPEPSAHPR